MIDIKHITREVREDDIDEPSPINFVPERNEISEISWDRLLPPIKTHRSESKKRAKGTLKPLNLFRVFKGY